MVNRASGILNKFHENYELDSIGSINVENIASNLYDKLELAGYPDVVIDVLLITEGIAVYFSDENYNDVIVLFQVLDDGTCKARVIANDEEDQQLSIDLSALQPAVVVDGSTTFFDFSDLSWMNQSVLNALLKAGKVDEAETYILKGDQKIRLPIVTIDASDSESEYLDELVYNLRPDWFEEVEDSEESELED